MISISGRRNRINPASAMACGIKGTKEPEDEYYNDIYNHYDKLFSKDNSDKRESKQSN